jgi:hypothetical protein
MLPLELSNPGFFGDDLQFVPGCVAFFLESVGVAVVIARAGGVGMARRSQGVACHGRSCSWSRGRIPPDEPENTKKIIRGEKDLKKGGCEEANDHHLRRAPARLPSASSLAGRLLLLFAMEFLGVLVLKRKALIGKGLKGRGLGERLGAPEVLIYGTGEEIVARDCGAYPKKFEK